MTRHLVFITRDKTICQQTNLIVEADSAKEAQAIGEALAKANQGVLNWRDGTAVYTLPQQRGSSQNIAEHRGAGS